MNGRYKRKFHIQNLDLGKLVTFVGELDMPVLLPFYGEPPERLIPFHVARNSYDIEAGVHFFIDDYQFERIWQSPHRYLDTLKRFRVVIGPDFSQFADTPKSLRIWQNFRGKFLSAWWQSEGIRVIPNVTWSTPDSYAYCFDGHPRNSVIAIHSQGVKNTSLSTYLWRKGYEEAVKRLQPSLILRYGEVMPGENEEISIYYPNYYIKRLRQYGRKRKLL